ncbi:MAG: hypothetical protein IJY43_00010 [Clostridia bacterium]|nr:hypothetical protein [Clostridia bacterium]
MKKITSVVLAVALCLSLTLIFSSCSLFKHPIQKTLDKIEEKNNYSKKTFWNKEETGTVKLAGNAYYSSSSYHSDTYIEICDDGLYKYLQLNSGNWIKYKIEEDVNVDPLGFYEEILDFENYEKAEKNIYVQKDYVKFDNFEDVVIKIIEDGLTIEAERRMGAGGTMCDIKIEIFDIGKTEVTLPQANKIYN